MSTLPARMPATTTLVQKGKEYVKFYKTGVLNVWRNRKLAKQLVARYNARNSQQLISSFAQIKHIGEIEGSTKTPPGTPAPKTVPAAAVPAAAGQGLTRQDLLVLARTPSDTAKLPLFGVLLAVFFEFTPLVLIAFPRLSPSTCFSPSFQAKRDRAYLEARASLNGVQGHEAQSVYGMPRSDLLKLSAVLPGSPLFYRLFHTGALRRRLVDHMTFVRADDYFLRSEKAREELEIEELKASGRARALDISKPEQQLRQDLGAWVKGFREPADAGYFIERNRIS